MATRRPDLRKPGRECARMQAETIAWTKSGQARCGEISSRFGEGSGTLDAYQKPFGSSSRPRGGADPWQREAGLDRPEAGPT